MVTIAWYSPKLSHTPLKRFCFVTLSLIHMLLWFLRSAIVICMYLWKFCNGFDSFKSSLPFIDYIVTFH